MQATAARSCLGTMPAVEQLAVHYRAGVDTSQTPTSRARAVEASSPLEATTGTRSWELKGQTMWPWSQTEGGGLCSQSLYAPFSSSWGSSAATSGWTAVLDFSDKEIHYTRAACLALAVEKACADGHQFRRALLQPVGHLQDGVELASPVPGHVYQAGVAAAAFGAPPPAQRQRAGQENAACRRLR